MSKLLRKQRARHDADDLATFCQDRISKDSHESCVSTTVHGVPVVNGQESTLGTSC